MRDWQYLAREVFGVRYLASRKAATAFIDELRLLQENFGLNLKLSSLGFKEDELDRIANVAYKAMYNVVVKTPKKLLPQDLSEIIKRAF